MRSAKLTVALATAGAGVICLAPSAGADVVTPGSGDVAPGVNLEVRPCIRVATPGVNLEIVPCVKVRPTVRVGAPGANLEIHPCIKVGSPGGTGGRT
jgi:hypothetical protein